MTELEKAKANLEQIRQILEGVYEDGELAGASALAECERRAMEVWLAVMPPETLVRAKEIDHAALIDQIIANQRKLAECERKKALLQKRIEQHQQQYTKAAIETRQLRKLIGYAPDGSHPDEWKPRAETWHGERINWTREVECLRAYIAECERKLAAARKATLALMRSCQCEGTGGIPFSESLGGGQVACPGHEQSLCLAREGAKIIAAVAEAGEGEKTT